MARTKGEPKEYKCKPFLTPDAEEKQLISLAMERAKEQLINGTASSQVITHFLKLGSSKEQLEKELLAQQTELAAAKSKQLRDTEKIERLYNDAMKAMSEYSGKDDDYE